jgi:hypothetical protein
LSHFTFTIQPAAKACIPQANKKQRELRKSAIESVAVGTVSLVVVFFWSPL